MSGARCPTRGPVARGWGRSLAVARASPPAAFASGGRARWVAQDFSPGTRDPRAARTALPKALCWGTHPLPVLCGVRKQRGSGRKIV